MHERFSIIGGARDRAAPLSLCLWVQRFGYLLTSFCQLVSICNKKRSWISNGIIFRVKLRRRKYSLRIRFADTVGRYGFLTKHTSLQRQLQ